MTDKELEDTRRDYAEKIIAGEYKSVVLLLLDEEGKLQIFHDGGRFNAIGMVRDAEYIFIRAGESE